MSEAKRLDIPELREKIRSILFKAEYRNDNGMGNISITGALDIPQINSITDQLVALISPLIEEAKKQEREARANTFGYIEHMYPELRLAYWNTKSWKDFKSEQLASP